MTAEKTPGITNVMFERLEEMVDWRGSERITTWGPAYFPVRHLILAGVRPFHGKVIKGGVVPDVPHHIASKHNNFTDPMVLAKTFDRMGTNMSQAIGNVATFKHPLLERNRLGRLANNALVTLLSKIVLNPLEINREGGGSNFDDNVLPRAVEFTERTGKGLIIFPEGGYRNTTSTVVGSIFTGIHRLCVETNTGAAAVGIHGTDKKGREPVGVFWGEMTEPQADVVGFMEEFSVNLVAAQMGAARLVGDDAGVAKLAAIEPASLIKY